MIRPSLIAAIITSLIVSGCTPGQGDAKQGYKDTTIPGTWAWDVESNRPADRQEADFWWEQVSATERYLVPLNGAKATIVQGQDFERIDAGYIRKIALSQEKLRGDALKPGVIVAFRTAEGGVGKLQVLGYKPLHDFDFPEAASLTEAWKQFALSQPNMPLYHLQVRWTLFK
jgi:hypothetical protein